MKFSFVDGASWFLVPLVISSVCKSATASQPALPGPSFILGGISNVASSASNFLSGVVKRQRELLDRVTDTASDYVASAVEMPRNLLMNATKMTTNYIFYNGKPRGMISMGDNYRRLIRKRTVDSAASIGLDYKLKRVLERFRSRMQYGFPDLGVPVLEPLELRDLYLRTQSPEIGNVTLFVNDVTIEHLSTFRIDRARLSLIGPTITVNLTFPNVIASGYYYNISGMLGDLCELRGSGKFNAEAQDFRIYFKTVLGYSRGMYMKSFDLDFSMESMYLELESFMGRDEIGNIMTQVFGELVPQALEVIKPEILPPIQDFIAARVNDTIYHLTMRDVMNFLLGEGDARSFPLPLL